MKFLIGMWILLTSETNRNKPQPTVGVCSPNGVGDDETADKLLAKIVRVEYEDAVEYSLNGKHSFFVTVGSSSESPQQIADKISQVWLNSPRKPAFFAVTNEENEYMFEDVYEIRKRLPAHINVIKGAHSAAVENAGEAVYDAYFKGDRSLDDRKDLPHLLHFYLKPTWKPFNFFENLKRMALLAYTVRELQKRGYINLWITESHDGTTESDQLGPHGDFVYASGWGFKKIINLAANLGVTHVFYYQAPFPNYKGNTMYGWSIADKPDDKSAH